MFPHGLDEVWCFRGRPEGRCRSHHIMSRIYVINMAYHQWCQPWTSGWVHVCQVSPKFIPLLSIDYLWKAVTMYSTHLRCGELGTASWGQSQKIIWNSLQEICLFSSFIQLFSWPSVSVDFAPVNSTNYKLKILGKNYVCTEHIQTFFFVIIPQTMCNNYLHGIYIVVSIISNL